MCSRSTYCRISVFCIHECSQGGKKERGEREREHLKWDYILQASFQVASSQATIYTRGRKASPVDRNFLHTEVKVRQKESKQGKISGCFLG